MHNKLVYEKTEPMVTKKWRIQNKRHEQAANPDLTISATQQQHNMYMDAEPVQYNSGTYIWIFMCPHSLRFCSYFIPFISTHKRKGKQYKNTVQNEEGSLNRTCSFNVHHTNRISSITRLNMFTYFRIGMVEQFRNSPANKHLRQRFFCSICVNILIMACISYDVCISEKKSS